MQIHDLLDDRYPFCCSLPNWNNTIILSVYIWKMYVKLKFWNEEKYNSISEMNTKRKIIIDKMRTDKYIWHKRKDSNGDREAINATTTTKIKTENNYGLCALYTYIKSILNRYWIGSGSGDSISVVKYSVVSKTNLLLSAHHRQYVFVKRWLIHLCYR